MSKYDRFYTLDEPVQYKNLTLYPVKVKDYDMFYKTVSCLTLEKNSIPDVKFLKMSYLEYLDYLHENLKEDEIDFLYLFDFLLQLCIKNDKVKIRHGHDTKTGKPIFVVAEEIFNAADFDEIRTIITEQNMVVLVDESIQKEIRDKMEEARRLKAQLNGTLSKPASFEDTMLCLVAATSLSFEEVKELSLRKFVRLLQRADALLHYQIYMTAAMSGMVEFKDKSVLRHWMSDLEKENKNDDVLLGFDTIKDKVSGTTQSENK
jgi:hypothetical protein